MIASANTAFWGEASSPGSINASAPPRWRAQQFRVGQLLPKKGERRFIGVQASLGLGDLLFPRAGDGEIEPPFG